MANSLMVPPCLRRNRRWQRGGLAVEWRLLPNRLPETIRCLPQTGTLSAGWKS